CYFIFFFFSSRRRHTRSKRDWSSDVCSSDLSSQRGPSRVRGFFRRLWRRGCLASGPLRGQRTCSATPQAVRSEQTSRGQTAWPRSEERRVGKEWRCRRGAAECRKKERRKCTT